MAVLGELLLVQFLYVVQRIFQFIKRLGHHCLAYSHRQAHIAQQPSDLGLMAHHEIGFAVAQACQAIARQVRRFHQVQFLAGAHMAVVGVANDEDLAGFETLRKVWIETLQILDQQSVVNGQPVQ